MVPNDVCSTCGGSEKVIKVRYRKEYLCKDCREIHRKNNPRGYPCATLEQARTAYEKNRSRLSAKPLPDFDTLHSLFRSKQSFEEIGKPYGLSRERIRLINWYYFSQSVPKELTGRVRMNKIWKKRVRTHALTKARKVFSARFSVLITEVKKHNIKARRVFIENQKSGFQSSGRLLCLNGHVCKFLFCKIPMKVQGLIYWHTYFLDFQNAELLVLQVGDGVKYRYRFFIIPVNLLHLGGYYIRVQDRSGYHNIQPKNDLLKFENRWDLLNTETSVQQVQTQLPAMTSPA